MTKASATRNALVGFVSCVVLALGAEDLGAQEAAGTSTTFGANTESTYDWENSQWTVPVNASVGQLLKVGNLPISLGLGARYYAERPAGGPEWGLRFTVTFLLPK